jgi:hypothetical protein
VLAADTLQVGLTVGFIVAEALGIWGIIDASRFPRPDWDAADLSKTGSIVLMFFLPVTALYYFFAMRADLKRAAVKRAASEALG